MTKNVLRKKRHRNNLSLKCPKCPATLSSHHHLERHLNAHENQMGKFECGFCEKKFEIKHRYQVTPLHSYPKHENIIREQKPRPIDIFSKSLFTSITDAP